jgi:hypothetical protein
LKRGRKRPADAELLLNQVAAEFKKKRDELKSAKRAAKQLGVCLTSFYKYMAKQNVPDIDVLRAATEKWGIKWMHLDPSEVIRPPKVPAAKQFVFPFLSNLEEDDIQIVHVAPEGVSALQVVLKIRFPAYK